MGVLKRFIAIPAANPGEQKVKDSIKRHFVEFLQEGQPRFHSLKRTFTDKAEKQSNNPKQTPNPPPPPPIGSL